jgi:hypothetical protein
MDELGLDSLGELAYLTLPSQGTLVEMGKAWVLWKRQNDR